MSPITFITGNPKKAEYLQKYLGFPVEHLKLDLDELQSMDLRVIVEHKVKQAYEHIRRPVLVEDVSLEFEAYNGLPGPFIRFFVDNLPLETIASMVDGKSRHATAKCVYGYYDGTNLQLFEGSVTGTVAETLSDKRDFGWNAMIIPDGHTIPWSDLDEEAFHETYVQIRPFAKLKAFLSSLPS